MTARRAFRFVALGGIGLGLYGLFVRGLLTVDLGIGRTERPLGPLAWQIAAPRERLFEVIASIYLDRTPHALETKLRVLERSEEMVLAEHFTPVGPLVTTTLETVRSEPPERVSFRLVRGPVRTSPNSSCSGRRRPVPSSSKAASSAPISGRWDAGAAQSSHPAGRPQCMNRSARSRPRRSGEPPASSPAGSARRAHA
ncbi:MAG: hypothetical protein ACRDOF_05215 [Gaiellaceae bacterium]